VLPIGFPKKSYMLNLDFGVGVEVTETLRWAMYKHPLGYGLNAQTDPKALRYFKLAPEGRIFVGGDLSQVEARVVAYLSHCQQLIDCFNDPKRSVHLENAIAVLGRSVEKDTPEYTMSKSIVHGSNFREGPKVLSSQCGKPIKECRKLMQNYHRNRPEIYQWHDWTWNEIKTKGKLTNHFGDSRTFYEAVSAFSVLGKMTDQHWKDAISWIPQSTPPRIIGIALVEIAKLRDAGMDIWFHYQGHDSFLCSIPIGEERNFFIVVKPIFDKIKLHTFSGVFVIPVEFQVGYNFGDMVGYRGDCLSRTLWQAMVDKKLARQPRHEQILTGTYSVHLADWRP
jgi:DNA polymerase I-like protein with 3'-5' exonuclease and polymerase domains